jgi:hypothetical protein
MDPHFSAVFKYFEFYKEEKVSTKNVEQIHLVYKCLICRRLGKKDKNSEFKSIRCLKGVTSNLIRHLECLNHENEYEEYQKSKTEGAKKRPFSEIQNSPSNSPYKFPFSQNSLLNGQANGSPARSQKNNLVNMGAVTQHAKYTRNGPTHQERYLFNYSQIIEILI